MASFVLAEDETLASVLVQGGTKRRAGEIPSAAPSGGSCSTSSRRPLAMRGHADIVREALHGALSGPLMAAAEAWPEDGWVRPWRPTG
jgi:hypothetical protein